MTCGLDRHVGQRCGRETLSRPNKRGRSGLPNTATIAVARRSCAGVHKGRTGRECRVGWGRGLGRGLLSFNMSALATHTGLAMCCALISLAGFGMLNSRGPDGPNQTLLDSESSPNSERERCSGLILGAGLLMRSVR